jgi:tetratricopeptide (TPR) repeat protein
MNIEARRYYNEGVRLGLEGKGDDAIGAYTKSIEIDPAAGAYNNRCAEYVKKAKYDMAVSDANKSILMNGNYAMPYFNRGNAFFKMNNFKSALKSYLRAIEIGPAPAELYFNCGQAYFRLDKMDESLDMFNKTVALDRKNYAAYYNMGCVYALQNNAPKALECIEQSIAAGFADSEKVKNDPALEKIRNTARFRALIWKIKKKGKGAR